jgi:hypothetical protein
MKVDTPLLVERRDRIARYLLANGKQRGLTLAAGTLNPGIGGKRPAETLVGAGAFQTRSRQMLDGDGAGTCTA